MSISVLHNIPYWVWGILVALIGIGIVQSFPNRQTLKRATLVPLALLMLSFFGVVSVFSANPVALAAWTAGLAVAVTVSVTVKIWNNIQWLEAEQQLLVPGSWLPMILMLGIFAIKFNVSIILSANPAMASNLLFAGVVSTAYGLISGVFLSRSIMMWQVAKFRNLGPIAGTVQ